MNINRISLSLLLLFSAHAVPLFAQRTTSLGKPIFPRLAYTDVGAELGLAQDMLAGFGARVDYARRFANTDALAAEAVLLSFAEEVAGKTAPSVTSLMLLKEAGRIAEENMNPTAERAIAAASLRVNGGEQVLDRLREGLAMVSQRRGEGNFVGYVRVVNKTGRLIDVYIDGKYTGFLSDEEEHVYSTGHGTTQVRVMDAFGNTANEIMELKQEDTFTWTVKP